MKKILAASAVLICAAVQAQDKVWTLQDCIGYALEHNITVKQNEVGVQEREIQLSTAKGRRLPGIAATASENVSFGRGLTGDNIYVNRNTAATSFGLGAEVPVFNGLDIHYDVKMSKLQLSAATENLEKVKNDIRVTVAQSYTQVLYSKEMLNVSKSQIMRDSLQLSRLEAFRQNGKATQADVAAQQASLAQTRLSAVQAENNLKLALLELSQLLELPSPEGFDVASPDASALEPAILLSPEDIYEQAVEIRPEITSGKIMLEYARINISRAKGGYMPSINLNGGIGTNYYNVSGAENLPFGTQMKNNFSQYIGLSLNIPIFSRMNTINSVKTAKLDYTNRQLEMENIKKGLFKEIQQVYYNAVAAQSKLQSSKEAAASAELSMNLTTEKYENGKANITEYNESKNRYLEAEANYLQARYECLFRTKLVDFYRGMELKF